MSAPAPAPSLEPSAVAHPTRRSVRSTLLLAGLLFIATRAIALVLHFFSRDAHGNLIAASPLNALIVALPYHGTVVLGTVGVLLLLWKILPPLRPVVTGIGVILCLAGIVLGQVDFGMQWFIGQRFSPMIFGTYVGANVLSTDLVGPVLFHPVYLAVALALMFGPPLLLALNYARQRRGATIRPPRWWLIIGLIVTAELCRIPVWMAHGHQRDVMRPPELLFAYHWLYPSETPAPADEERAVRQLRNALETAGPAEWLDPQLPLVRAASSARNRFLAGATPVARPDIILICVESLRAADVGYVPGNDLAGGSPTPHLDRLARQGVVFAHHLSNGNPSPRGFFSLNAGVWDHRSSFIISGSTGTEFDALPARLRRRGYYTLALWGANPSFDNQLFWGNKWYDRPRFAAPDGLVITEPVADDVLMDEVMAEITAHDRARPDQPLFAYVSTSGTHEPYQIHGRTNLPAEFVDTVAAEKNSRRRYRLVLRNLDAQIGRLLAFLDRRDSTRPRLVIVTGDHSDVAGDDIPPEMRGLPHNAVVWSAALVAGPPALIGPVPRVETFPSSHVDFMPTLLDLVGDRGPTVSMGVNLFADLPLERRSAVAISGRGFRLDRGGWSLLVLRDHPDTFWTLPAFAPLTAARPGGAGSPFGAADARRLVDNINTWSFIIERNRVWRQELLEATP